MIPFRSLRRHPYFAPLFDGVHPLFWPVLWWSLNRFLKWYDTAGYSDIASQVTRWGRVRVVYLGDRLPDPSAYRPYVLTRPRFDDPRWESDVPVAMQALSLATLQLDATHSSPACGGGGSLRSLWRSRLTVGAFPIPNTS